ncbi:3'(2'),5'-bisphosphate nucleotidase CysQ [Desulfosarcina sp. OttesenSCG-928-A07]|nr:3'(2'),5'-bisphosphate nucleotidase CysQ [Desulfosarcina sp. OttesenSCG-928-G17]MDL2329236.1 3'(2'),5'-bisphosphate nucleotidase CysQ [Desulfosarcina sp. OttesenSCG-928-A07]
MGGKHDYLFTKTAWERLSYAVFGALSAGRAILEIYEASDFGVRKKSDGSPLTHADEAANACIQAAIGHLEIPVLSEEGAALPFDVRRDWDLLWIVDPLDGTKEFISRNGEFTVNIALVENQTPILGVVFVPVSDTLYFSDPAQAFRVDACGKVMPDLGPSPPDPVSFLLPLMEKAVRLPLPQDPERPFTVMGSRSHATPELAAYVDAIRQAHPDLAFISAGSSLKICRVAEGRADIYPRLGPTMEWDTAAGQAIAAASGARMIQYPDGPPLVYNKPDLRNPWFVVTTGNG